MTQQEVERLKNVYQSYRERGVAHRLWSNKNSGNQAIRYERMRVLQRLLHSAGFMPLTERVILDVGCGDGSVLASLCAWGALPGNLYGIDLLPTNIEAAQKDYPNLWFQQSNAEELNFDDQTFDLVLFFTVFSSILDPSMARHMASEAQRVLKPGGAVAWYDFRYHNLFNTHTQPMTYEKIQTLFFDFAFHLRTVTLLPPLARRLGRLTPLLYSALCTLPFLRTHHVGLLIKPQ